MKLTRLLFVLFINEDEKMSVCFADSTTRRIRWPSTRYVFAIIESMQKYVTALIELICNRKYFNVN